MASTSIRASSGRRATCTVARGRCWLAKVESVDVVYRREIFDGRQVDRRLHDVVKGRAHGLEDGADVLTDPVSLTGNILAGQLARAWIERNLTGDEHKLSCPDPLRVGADRARCAVGRDSLSHRYAAFETFLERRHRVHTRIRRMPPLMLARTVCRLGFEPPTGHVVRVADVPAERRTLAANLTLSRHAASLLSLKSL